MYNISDYSQKQADKLGVTIKPSTKKGKKIDVMSGNKIISIGALGYKDYPAYLKIDKRLATERRRLYKLRHEKDRNVPGSAGYFADKLLW